MPDPVRKSEYAIKTPSGEFLSTFTTEEFPTLRLIGNADITVSLSEAEMRLRAHLLALEDFGINENPGYVIIERTTTTTHTDWALAQDWTHITAHEEDMGQ